MNAKQAREIVANAKTKSYIEYEERFAAGYLEAIDKAKGLEEAAKDFQELNLENYSPQDAEVLNAWGVGVAEALAKYRSEK